MISITKLRMPAVGCLVGLVVGTCGFAQTPPAAPLAVHQLQDGVSWVEGGGGNSGVLLGTPGVVVIDAKISEASAKELVEDIAKLTPKPVNTLIETHSDRDHVNGVAGFPAGLTIIAQKNDKAEQERALAGGGKDAPLADRLPTRLVTQNREKTTIDGFALELLHWGPAHTSGDLVVFLPKQKIVFTGDLITNRPDPLIHLEKSGSSLGWIAAARGLIALDATTYVAGHGPVQTKAQLKELLARVEAKRAQIQKLVSEGKSLDEIKTAVGDPAPAPGSGPGFATFTEVVYQELAKK